MTPTHNTTYASDRVQQLQNRDYKENEKLDRYDNDSADEDDFDAMDAETRQLVEAKLRRRDREKARLEGRLPAAYIDDGMVFLYDHAQLPNVWTHWQRMRMMSL